MSDTLHRIKDAVCTAFVWFAVGFTLARLIAPAAPAPAPIPVVQPAPAPIAKPVPAPVHHTGHLTVSYIEPRYGSPTSASIRDALAAVDWKPLDATFRSYTEGQDELKTLGFTKHFTAADLPVLFVQESGPTGAPLVGAPLKAPASAQAVLDRVKELRGN